MRARIPSGRRWGSGILAASAGGWLIFTVAHLLFTGRVWWWVLPDMLPPPVYVVVPLLVVAVWGTACLVRRPPAGWGSRAALLCSAGALVIGAQGSGLNFAAVTGGSWSAHVGRGGAETAAGAPAGVAGVEAIRIASWDTLFWDQNEDADRFYAYLHSLDADVYLLQEYMVQGADGPAPVDDSARLRAEFPGYTLVGRGELLTLSRLPVVGQQVLTARPMAPLTLWADYWDARVLRTDLLAGGRTLSVYNVHIADPFDLGQSPFTAHFYKSVHQLGAYREAQWRVLGSDIAANQYPMVVSGALNTLPSMGELRHLSGLRDAVSAGGTLYPVSFAVRGAWLWRLDATYTSPGVGVAAYRLRDPSGLSTHKAQLTTVSLPVLS